MTQEEKIKRYDEALERAKKLQETCDSQAVVGWCEYLFPELKESEDERIRSCIGMCLTDANEQRFKDYGTNLKDCLVWLEKQGELVNSLSKGLDNAHERIDGLIRKNNELCIKLESQGEKEEPQVYKAEDGTMVTYSEKEGYNSVRPKFKVGDFVINEYCMGRVMEITDDAYLLDTEQGIPFSYENNAHLWTLDDANPGDVLSGKIDGDNYILIFKQVKDGWVETYGHYYDAVHRFCAPSQLFCRDYQGTFAPATKEQRDLLFSKMIEAGYEWDAERKELKKIEYGATWNEKDDAMMKNLCYFLREYGTQYYGDLTLAFTISWLKSLKQRAGV